MREQVENLIKTLYSLDDDVRGQFIAALEGFTEDELKELFNVFSAFKEREVSLIADYMRKDSGVKSEAEALIRNLQSMGAGSSAVDKYMQNLQKFSL